MQRARTCLTVAFGVGLLGIVSVGAADNAKPGRTKVAYNPQERAIATPALPRSAAALPEDGEYVFSTPPRGSYTEDAAIYEPIAEYLSRVTGKRFVYRYSGNWLSYSKEMTNGAYDLAFDGPAYNGWRVDRMNHTPLVKLSDESVFVVISRRDNRKVTEIKHLAGQKICAEPPPSPGALTVLSQFDNPARQPVILESGGWDNAYKGLLEGKCAGTVVPLQTLEKHDRGTVKVLYQSRALPNQAFSAGPRIAPVMQEQIRLALLSAEGKAVTAKLRAANGSSELVAAKSAEYADLGKMLKNSLYYY